MSMQSALCISDVTIQRGGRALAKSLSLSLPVGEILGVLGPNGAGKTSLLSACSGECSGEGSGERSQASGEIECTGVRVATATAQALSRRRAVLPQQSTLTFNLPIRQIIEMGAYPFPEIDPLMVRRWCDAAIAQTDLQAHLSKRYDALSGGEQQRVQFSRVLVHTRAIAHVNGAACLFLDEPTSSLDLKHQSQLMSGLREIAKAKLAGVFIILHDLNMAARWCDQLLLLSPTFAPVYGSAREVLRESILTKVYGVPMSVVPHPTRLNGLWVMSDE